MHVCPALRNLEAIVWFTAKSISASAATITGACPPSSIETCFIVSALFVMSDFPTGAEPVHVIFRMYGLLVKMSPIVGPSPFTHCTTSLGIPAWWASSISFMVVSGVSSAGLTTNVQPAARAGAAFLVIIAAGKFQGVIAATGPTG